MPLWAYIAIGAWLLINFTTLCLYVNDKKRAGKGAWRIPEARLLAFAACFGAAGALAGMYIWRHKTKHKAFTICVPLFLLMQIAITAFVLIYFELI